VTFLAENGRALSGADIGTNPCFWFEITVRPMAQLQIAHAAAYALAKQFVRTPTIARRR